MNITLYLHEKLEIIRFADKNSLLKQRMELTVNCKHSLPFTLQYV